MIHVKYCNKCGKLFYTSSKGGRNCNDCLTELGRKLTKNLNTKQTQTYLEKRRKAYRKK